MSSPSHAQPGRRNRIVALGVGLVLALILLVVLLTQCGSPGDDTGQPGPSGPPTSQTVVPPVTGPNSPGPDPNSPGPDPNSPGPDPNSPGPDPDSPEPDPNAPEPDDTTTTPPPPQGGVDAGGGSGAEDRRVPLLVTGIFLLLAALGTAGVAVGRRSRA